MTSNYGFNEPVRTDSMADFDTWLNANWDKMNAVNSSRVVANLPAVGNYAIGDRLYSTTDKSIYICICNDPIWGVIWRPVHKALSPWRNLPATVSTDQTIWSVTDVKKPIQMALDNQGRMYFRGVLTYVTGPHMVKNQTYKPLIPLGQGMQPREDIDLILAHDDYSGAAGTGGYNEWDGFHMHIPHINSETQPSSIELTYIGGSALADPRKIYFDGKVEYAVGTGVFETG